MGRGCTTSWWATLGDEGESGKGVHNKALEKKEGKGGGRRCGSAVGVVGAVQESPAGSSILSSAI